MDMNHNAPYISRFDLLPTNFFNIVNTQCPVLPDYQPRYGSSGVHVTDVVFWGVMGKGEGENTWLRVAECKAYDIRGNFNDFMTRLTQMTLFFGTVVKDTS